MDDYRSPLIPTLNEWDLQRALDHLRDDGMVLLADQQMTAPQFIEVTSALMESLPQSGVAAGDREGISPADHVATVNKGVDPIPLHREASFLPTQPDILALYCEQPPLDGGQTTLCDGVAFLQTLPPDVARFATSESLDWTLRVPPERWRTAFGSDSPHAAARRIDQLMARSPLASYQYRFEDDWLEGTYQCPLVLPTFWTGQPAFCNSMLSYYFRNPGPHVAMHLHSVGLTPGCRPIPPETLTELHKHAEALTIDVQWQEGDVLLVDNSHVMHGRRAVSDTKRRIHVRFGHYRPEVVGAGVASGPLPRTRPLKRPC